MAEQRLRILLTNIRFGFRSGTEIVVRDFALGLQRRGHEVTIYSPKLEALAVETRTFGVRVINDLRLLRRAPDVIHAQHITTSLLAMARFPGVPAIWMCHSSDGWIDTPPVFPQISTYCAVDEVTRERILSTPGIDPARIAMLPNATDLRRFPPRPEPLPSSPRRALVFGKATAVAPLIEACCREAGIDVSAIGYEVDNAMADPEPHLARADIVFASARAAIEGIVAGAAVVVMDGRGLSGMATTQNADFMRRNNFGLRTLVHPLSSAAIAAAIADYDSADAAAVSTMLRSEADLETSLDRLEAMYRNAIGESAAAGDRSAATTDALTGFLQDWLPSIRGEPKAWQKEQQRLATASEAQVQTIAALQAECDALLAEQAASATGAAAAAADIEQLTARIAVLQSANKAMSADQLAMAASATTSAADIERLTARNAALHSESKAALAHQLARAAALTNENAQLMARLDVVQSSRPYRLGRWLREGPVGRLLAINSPPVLSPSARPPAALALPTHAEAGPRGYVICTAPRSGSNFLCQMLETTGVLGRPKEYFNGHGRRVFDDPTYPDDRHDQVRQILTTGATPNGIYGLKIFAHQHDWIAGKIAWTSVLPELSFVYLKREDLLGQAISWAKALQSGQYRWGQEGRGELAYNGPQIAKQLRLLVTEYARWELYFAQNGIAPMRLTYETLTRDPQASVGRIARHFGIELPGSVRPAEVTVRIQRDTVSDGWRTRFIDEYGNRDVLEMN